MFRSKMARTTDEGARELIPDVTMDIPCPDPQILPGSMDVNILLLVQEHVPRRLDEIHNELQGLHQRREKLEKESRTLQRLFGALEESNG